MTGGAVVVVEMGGAADDELIWDTVCTIKCRNTRIARHKKGEWKNELFDCPLKKKRLMFF